MPQNWWELFPEVQPSPFAPRRPLPGPGGMLPGPPMAPPTAAPYAAIGLGQAAPGAFDPAYFSGGQLGGGQFPGRFPSQAMPVGYPQPLGRSAVVQQAAAAIRDGADPKAVRARLQEMTRGDSGLDASNAFSDLLPEDQPGLRIDPLGRLSGSKADAPYTLLSMQALEAQQDRRIADQMARERGGDAELADEIYRGMRGLPPRPPRNPLSSEPPVHAAPVLNDHPLPYPSHVEGDDIVVTGPRLAARQAIQNGAQLQELGRILGSGEGNYESYNSGTLGRRGPVVHRFTNPPPGTVTGRTINEILSTEPLSPRDPRRMHAVGRYQIIIPTLRRAVTALHLTGNERLTPELQDRIFAEFLIPRPLRDFIFNGTGTVDDAQDAAARIWASIAVPQGRLTETRQISRGDRTYYDRSPANRASRSATNALRTYLINLPR